MTYREYTLEILERERHPTSRNDVRLKQAVIPVGVQCY